MAGLAFSSFALVKILVFIPAGFISDKFGHFTGFFIGLAAQILTLGLILWHPELVWAARSAEGITLAFGTISALALLRAYAKDGSEFGKSISLLMGIGSSGFLIGPFFGYQIPIQQALTILLVGSVIVCVIHWLLYKIHVRSLKNLILDTGEAHSFPWAFVLCFALAKGLGVGTEPLLGWWATEKIGLTPALAGLTFVSAALGFMLANVKPRAMTATLGLFGVLFIELALAGHHILWWPALLCLGLYSGTMINLCLTKLGWNKPENLGTQNAKWLALSDIPMMVTPALLWSLREPQEWPIRASILAGTMIVSLFLLRRRV